MVIKNYNKLEDNLLLSTWLREVKDWKIVKVNEFETNYTITLQRGTDIEFVLIDRKPQISKVHPERVWLLNGIDGNFNVHTKELRMKDLDDMKHTILLISILMRDILKTNSNITPTILKSNIKIK